MVECLAYNEEVSGSNPLFFIMRQFTEEELKEMMAKKENISYINKLNLTILEDLVEPCLLQENEKLVLMELEGHDIHEHGIEVCVKFWVQLLSGNLEAGTYKFFLPLKKGFSFCTNDYSDCSTAIINHIMDRIETLSRVERKDILYILAVNLTMETYSLKLRKELKYLPTVIF